MFKKNIVNSTPLVLYMLMTKHNYKDFLAIFTSYRIKTFLPLFIITIFQRSDFEGVSKVIIAVKKML